MDPDRMQARAEPIAIPGQADDEALDRSDGPSIGVGLVAIVFPDEDRFRHHPVPTAAPSEAGSARLQDAACTLAKQIVGRKLDELDGRLVDLPRQLGRKIVPAALVAHDADDAPL